MTGLWDHQTGLTQLSGWFTCLDNFLQATQEKKNPNKNRTIKKSACSVLDLIASWQVSLLCSQHTDRHWLCNRRLMGAGSGRIMQSDLTWWVIKPVHIAAVNGARRRIMSSHDMTERKDHNRMRERARGGNNSPWCKVQDLRFLPTVLFHLRLTLAAAQSNMPLCWRGRAMGTCFLLFSWPRHWLGMLSWAGGGYSNILSDANDPLMMQRKKKSMCKTGICSFLVHFFTEICFSVKPHSCYIL